MPFVKCDHGSQPGQKNAIVGFYLCKVMSLWSLRGTSTLKLMCIEV